MKPGCEAGLPAQGTGRLVRQAAGRWIGLFVLMLTYAWATDRLSLSMVPDSPSYLQYPFHSLDAALRSIRTPAYPILLQIVIATVGLSAIPLVQLALHATAATVMQSELLRWGSSNCVSWAVALAIAFGCTFVDNVSIVSTDCVAASVGVITAALLLRWIRLDRRWLPALPVVAVSVLAIAIRPAYLAIVPWIAIAGSLLTFPNPLVARRPQWFKQAIASLGLAVLCMLPIIGWMSLRGLVVGDFGLLPFGHQNLAGITIQLVSDTELESLSETTRDLAAEIVVRQHQVLQDEPCLASGDDGATMTIEQRWNSYVWYAVVPAAASLYGDDAIKSHRAISMLNREILRRYPLRYARWLAFGFRRAVWGTAANMIMQPIFLFGVLVAVVLQSIHVLRRTEFEARQDTGLNALYLVAVSYFIVMAGFVILTSPPLGRFVDAAAIFIPAWIAGRLVLHFSTLRHADASRHPINR